MAGHLFIGRLSPEGGGYNYRTGRHLSSSSERGKLISNPDPVLSYLLVFLVFLGRRAKTKAGRNRNRA